MFEQCYVATARGFVLSPEILGELAADPAYVADTLSAKYLLGLASKMQAEAARLVDFAAAAGKRSATFSLQSDLRFISGEQRAEFMKALQEAIAGITAQFASPAKNSDGRTAEGSAFRLVLGCYPVPPANDSERAGEAAWSEERH